MKVVRAIKNIIIGILVIVFFAFAIVMTVLLLNFNKYGVTEFDNSSLIIIKDELSSFDYKKGDLVVVEKRAIDKIELGDEIFVYKVSREGTVTIDIGIVGEIYLEEDAISFENGATYSAKFIAGEAGKVYNDVGKYLSVIESKWGFLFIILVPGFLIFIYQLYALIVEIKYGKEDTQ